MQPIDAGDPRPDPERADRNLSELLQELRVVLPGVQVLFAFLLTMPFAQGFARLTRFQEGLYLGVLMSTMLTAALLMAPGALHRMTFRRRDKEYLVVVANRLSVAGLGFLALSMCGVITLVSDFVFDAKVAAVATSAAGAVLAWFWFAMPALRRRQLDRRDAAPGAPEPDRSEPDRTEPDRSDGSASSCYEASSTAAPSE